jgi:colicin import membrane protein
MAPRTPRMKRSKTDIEQEFSTIAESVEAEKNSISSKQEAVAQIKEAEIKAAVSEITVELLSKKLAELSLEVSRTLGHLGEKMVAEVDLLKMLQEARAIEAKELEQLHGIDVAATSIDQLVVDYTEKKKQFETEIEKTRDSWEQEKKEKSCEDAEYAATLKKNRMREAEDYEYQKNLERKKRQDQFDGEIKAREKQNLETQEQLEKNWKERESALKQKEDEFAQLKKEVELFPARLAAEISKAVKEASKETETKYSQEIVQLKRDLAVERQIGELKLKQMQELLITQQNQMATLQAQFDEAKKQVQDIAVKAIESASGANALAHINQIAIEQAKNRTQN